ncbi:MAG: TatD family nuclease-associated radical SAM protein, partial [Myxococcota bacterium]
MANVYAYDGALYLAVTRRCTLSCTFCPKTHGRWVVAGNDMSNDSEPSGAALLAKALEANPSAYREVVFVGLGEPTLRLPVVTWVGRALRREGHHVRLVTDGLANLRFEEDVTPDLAGAVDEVHVSLNAPDGETYAKICPSRHGACAHEAVCDFILKVQSHVPKVVATAVA